MMSKEEMLSEICQYKLFLIQLLGTFEELQKQINDKEVKKILKKICICIEDQLKIRDKYFAEILQGSDKE